MDRKKLTNPEGRPRRVPAAAAAGIQQKSVISGDRRLGNDTSRARWADFSVRNRGPSCAHLYQKSGRRHFFDTLSGPALQAGPLFCPRRPSP